MGAVAGVIRGARLFLTAASDLNAGYVIKKTILPGGVGELPL